MRVKINNHQMKSPYKLVINQEHYLVEIKVKLKMYSYY